MLELQYRRVHHFRLIGDLLDVDPPRHGLHVFVGRRLHVLAEGENVRALRHDDADPEGRLSALAHKIVGRILEAADDRGDVAEAEDAAVRLDGRLGHGLFTVERSRDPQGHALRVALHRAGGNDRVLLLQRVEQRLRRNAEGGELRVAEFHVRSARPARRRD